MQLELGQLGAGGLIEDIKPFDLPPNIFNDTLNFEFTGFDIRPMVSEVSSLPDLPETREPIAHVQGWVAGDLIVHVVACVDSLWILYVGTWYDITPEDMFDSPSWNLFNFNGYILLNSPTNTPFYVDPYDPIVPVKVIPSWPETYKTTYLVGFNGFLFGLGLTSSDGFFDKQIVFWSDVAELGALPANFDFDDPTSRAGFVVLPESEDFVQALEIKNTLAIYRASTIYDVRFVGGNSVFAFDRRLKSTAILNANCVTEFNGLHFFIGKDAFYLYDGFNKRIAGNGQVSTAFFRNVNKAHLDKVFVHTDADLDQILIYYPEGTSEKVNRIYYYKYNDNLYYKRALSESNAFGLGRVVMPDDELPWDDGTLDSWLIEEGVWTIVYTDDRLSKVIWAIDNTFVHVPNVGDFMLGHAIRNYVAFADQDQSGSMTVNRTARKIMRELWPEMSDGIVQIAFAQNETVRDAVVFGTSQEFDASAGLKQDWFFSSKYISVRITNETETVPSYFELTGMKFELEFGGKY